MARKKYDVIILGGGPAGLITAVTAKAHHKDKSVALVRANEVGLIPCGIPYIIHQMGYDWKKDILPDAPLEKAGIDKIIAKAGEVDRSTKEVILDSGDVLEYDKLVLALGSRPAVPPIPGVDKDGVFTVGKTPDALEPLLNALKEANRVIIAGAGFIGLEVADELLREGKEVRVVEMADRILPAAFDEDVSAPVVEELENLGAKFYLGKKIVEITGESKASGVKLEDGTVLEGDVVILATGYKPNSDLPRKMGLDINPFGAVMVDEFLRTNDIDIFAVGDVASKVCSLTRRPANIMLASTAVSEARVAGINLYSLQVLKTFTGTISVFSTALGNSVLASAGLTEDRVKFENIDYVVGTFETVDRHPGHLPGAHKVKVKLLVGAHAGVLLGAQIYGGVSAAEMINMLGVAIQNRLRVDELYTLQIGTHPKLTAAPTVYPVIKAAENALGKLKI